MISIKRSSATTAPLSYYYFFYYWRVKEPNCLSPRVPVVAYADQNCGITGLTENSLEEFKVYPNPAKNELNLLIPAHQGQMDVTLWSLEGKKVKDLYSSSDSYNRHNETIDISNLPAGVYLARVTNQTKSQTIRLVIF